VKYIIKKSVHIVGLSHVSAKHVERFLEKNYTNALPKLKL